MEVIEKLYEITKQLQSTASNGNQGDREKQIEELEAYLESRGKLLDSVDQSLLTTDDKQKLREILSISEDVIKQMGKIKTSIQQNIINAKKGKSAFKGYNDPYASASFDGHYFDRKK